MPDQVDRQANNANRDSKNDVPLSSNQTKDDVELINIDGQFTGGKIIHFHPSKKIKLQELSPVQFVGFWLAMGIMAVILIVLIAIILYAVFNTPPMFALPSFASLSTVEDVERAQKYVAAYNELKKSSIEDTVKLFTTAISTTFIPVLTTILGYIFGSQAKKEKDDN